MHVGRNISARALAGPALLLALLGCAPPPAVRWSDQAPTAAPEREGGRGYLSVEMINPLVWSREPRMQGAPFLLYDDRGRYVTAVNDPYFPPLSIPAGRYIVVTRVEGENRQIQVVIRPAQLTRVDLSRLPDRQHPESPAEPAESLPEAK